MPKCPRPGEYASVHSGESAGLCGRVVFRWPAIAEHAWRWVAIELQGGQVVIVDAGDVEGV